MHLLLLALASLLPAGSDGAQLAPTVAPRATQSVDPVPPAASRIPDLVVHLEGTRLMAVSRSLEPCVLVLASPCRNILAARTIQPGAVFVTQHPPHALTGLWLEILAAPDGRLAGSGALALDGRDQRLNFTTSDAQGHVLGVQTERALARGPSFLGLARAEQPSRPLHVPIPSPGDKPPGGTPPPVEKDPLPPV
jgi:hypothetical protein